jgi:small subunit ribosomal protein S9
MKERNKSCTGRRKSATAVATIVDGNGNFFLERKKKGERRVKIPLDGYPLYPLYRERLLYPITLAKTSEEEWLKRHDFLLRFHGGGINGRVEAGALALSKLLCLARPELIALLKEYKCLTRDARVVLPKKYGLKKNRKRRQYRKR